jgi:putative cofactor-binding repeat protein
VYLNGTETPLDLGRGILSSRGSTISQNSVYQNRGHGIHAIGGSTIAGNADVGNASALNIVHGLTCGEGCNVSANVARGNGGWGLFLRFDAAYRENVITGNTLGAAGTLVGVNTGDHFCAGPGVADEFCP